MVVSVCYDQSQNDEVYNTYEPQNFWIFFN